MQFRVPYFLTVKTFYDTYRYQTASIINVIAACRIEPLKSASYFSFSFYLRDMKEKRGV